MKSLDFNRYILPMAIILLLAGCNNDDDNTCCDPSNPECPNYDLCFGESPTSADFKILAQLGLTGDAEFREELYFLGGQISFSAVERDANSYTWYLGVDTFYGTPEVVLGIGDLPIGTYSAILVLENDPNLNCFPEDLGRDSLYLTFTKIDRCEALVLGKFRGILNNQGDSLDIEVFIPDGLNGELCPIFNSPRFVNILGNNDTLLAQTSPYVYSKMNVKGDGSGGVRGVLAVNPISLSVTFEFEFGLMNNSFIGRKIN